VKRMGEGKGEGRVLAQPFLGTERDERSYLHGHPYSDFDQNLNAIQADAEGRSGPYRAMYTDVMNNIELIFLSFLLLISRKMVQMCPSLSPLVLLSVCCTCISWYNPDTTSLAVFLFHSLLLHFLHRLTCI